MLHIFLLYCKISFFVGRGGGGGGGSVKGTIGVIMGVGSKGPG